MNFLTKWFGKRVLWSEHNKDDFQDAYHRQTRAQMLSDKLEDSEENYNDSQEKVIKEFKISYPKWDDPDAND